MKSIVKKATVMGALIFSLGLTLEAQAVTAIGNVSGTSTFTSVTTAGSFADLYTFTVGPNAGSVFSLTSVTFMGNTVNITGVDLFEGHYADTGLMTGLTPVAQGMPAVDTAAGSFTMHIVAGYSIPLTPGGDYTMRVTGNSSSNSSYAGIVALAPVPEPETYALLTAGLGMMGAVVQRRRKKSLN